MENILKWDEYSVFYSFNHDSIINVLFFTNQMILTYSEARGMRQRFAISQRFRERRCNLTESMENSAAEN